MNRQLRALRDRPVVLDLGLAVLLAALSLILIWKVIFPDVPSTSTSTSTSTKLAYEFGSLAAWHWHVAAWLLAAGAGLGVLPLRHRFPLTVFLVTMAMATVHSIVLTFSPLPADLAAAVAVYTLATDTPRWRSLAGLASGVLLAVTADRLVLAWAGSSAALAKSLAGGWLGKPPETILLVVVLAASWLAGDGARIRGKYLAEVERRALDAERDRDRQAELAAAAERARITRELHDVIAHALSVIVIQAQGAGSALRRRHPEDTDEALQAIVTTGRRALAETRRLLGVVRRPAEEDPELAPQPGIADLPALIARVRQAGTPVELCVEGVPRPLAAGLELSAYRIIQEGLTNTIKHAGPGATATVRVRYGDAGISVEVADDGTGTSDRQHADSADPDDAERKRDGGSPRDGHGLPGMRARVAMLGGELTAGPAGPNGFRVHARLPLHAPEAAAVLARGDDPPRPPREGIARGDDASRPPRPPREGIPFGINEHVPAAGGGTI